MASNKKDTNEITSIQAALTSYDAVQAWMASHPIVVTDKDTKVKEEITRGAIGLTVNADAGLYLATIRYCAGPTLEYIKDGTLQYNAQTVGLRKILWATVKDYAPEGYTFDPGEVGSRGGEGVTAQLTATKTVVNELVATLVPLVRSGVLTIDQVPESSRAQVSALLAA